MQVNSKTQLGSREFWERLGSDPRRLAVEVCMVDLTDLDQTLQRHPALRAWVNTAHEAARVEEERARWEVTKARSLALIAATGALDERGKNKTVSVLEAEVETDPTVQQRTEELLQAQEKRGALRAIADALEDRKDMLIQIAAKRRKEADDYNR